MKAKDLMKLLEENPEKEVCVAISKGACFYITKEITDCGAIGMLLPLGVCEEELNSDGIILVPEFHHTTVI